MTRTGVLYVVSTPIGNAEDLTLRALRVLRDVHVVAAEDPRSTDALFRHHGIQTSLTSYQNLNKHEKTPILLNVLRDGRDVALVCDAGTPLICDPGSHLVTRARRAGIQVTAVPGPSAILAALVVSGCASDAFVFDGVIPSQPASRRRLLHVILRDTRPHVLFVSADRTAMMLRELASVLGTRRVVLAQDLTGTEESVMTGSANALARKWRPPKRQDAVTLVVNGLRKKPGTIRRRRVS